MQKLFISDLHLSEDHPRLIRGFLDLLQHYQTQQIELYILGDWFNAWLADNDPSPWLLPIVAQLRSFTQAGNQIFFLAGNRDFVLGQGFLNRFDGHLLQEPYQLRHQQQIIQLEHGDALCSDDVGYQRFKTIIRNPLLLGLLKCLPFYLKRRLAELFRHRSQQRQQAQQYLPVDVNADTVAQHLQAIDVLIHGHTHRPAIHQHGTKQRVVLGDWREDLGTAEILLLDDSKVLRLLTWTF